MNSNRRLAYEKTTEGHTKMGLSISPSSSSISQQHVHHYTAPAQSEGNGDINKGMNGPVHPSHGNGHASHGHAGLGIKAMPEIGEEKEKEDAEA